MKKKSIFLPIAVVLGIAVVALNGCGSKQNPESTSQGAAPSTSVQPTGTITIDANISAGTRFIIYSNNVWTSPQREQLVPGEWHQYQFTVATPLQSLRLDPSEVSGATILIRSITVNLPGQSSKAFPLAMLPNFLKNNASVSYDPGRNLVEIHSTGPNMDIMSGVDPSTFPAAS